MSIRVLLGSHSRLVVRALKLPNTGSISVCRNSYSSKTDSSTGDSEFRSSISLDKLYPGSRLSIARTPTIPEEKDPNSFSGYIPMDKIKISYCKSSGPGGQNVNTRSTKVEVRFHVETAQWIPATIRVNFVSKFANTISNEGYFHLTSDRTRSQHMNTADALEKLREMIRSCEPVALAEVSPETLEKLRKQRERVTRERLHEKRSRSGVKGSRGPAAAASFE